MVKRMLIDASHTEETRVVVAHGTRLEEFDFESEQRKQLKGNICLAKVMRVEPSLQAAFVDYGGNRHGFLPFSEIHPDYYQIPVADREALFLEQKKASEIDEQDDTYDDSNESLIENITTEPNEPINKNLIESKSPDKINNDDSPPNIETSNLDKNSKNSSALQDSSAVKQSSSNNPPKAPVKSTTIDVEEVGGDEIDDIERRRTSASRSLLSRRYKIQEVIKKRQILLVQVAKEERGNKGAALTTYLSLAGRYCVLMPNAVRGGGISRKITSQEDRKRLKSILAELQVPTRMGVIVRTAGTERSKAEIRRDFEYLIRQWEKIRELTLNSIAPVIIYEEGNLIKRSIRDLYTRDVEQILVDGDEGYRIAKDFMRMLIPSHTSKVQPYRERTPLFSKYKIETQLDSMYSPEVKLKSGGSLVINSTEALVAIDVNSGKATRERNIEETAVKTNIEAASEVARQLRLRDLAGLIVVDFIDMEGTRNQRSVERKLKEGMRVDRARIQIGRISPFGLLELSRQRLRPSITESSMEVCDVCEGTGIVRSIGSSAVHVLRAIEEEGLRNLSSAIQVSVPAKVAYYILNRKRSELAEIERICKFSVDFAESTGLIAPMYQITRLKSKNTDSNEVIKVPENISETSNTEIDNNDSETNKRRRRRRKPRNTVPAKNTVSEVEAETIKDKVDINLDTKIEKDESDPDSDSTSSPKRRRRGKRGGRRRPTNSIIEGNDSINNPTSINSDQPTQSENLKNKNMSKNTQPPKTNSIIKNDKSNSKVIANDEKEKDKIKPAPKRRVPTQTKNKQKNSEKVVSKPSPKKEGSKKPIVKQDETLINGEDTSVKKPKIEEKQPARRGWWNKGSKAE